MWEIWANSLLLKALKSSPKSNKLPNLVTLFVTPYNRVEVVALIIKSNLFFQNTYLLDVGKKLGHY